MQTFFGSGHNQLKWKQRLHHLFPLRALLLHKLSGEHYELPERGDAWISGYTARPRPRRGWGWALIWSWRCVPLFVRASVAAIRNLSQRMPMLLSALVCFLFCTCSAGNHRPGPWERAVPCRGPTKVAQLSAIFQLLFYAIYHLGSSARRHLSTLISCFPQLFTWFPKIRLLTSLSLSLSDSIFTLCVIIALFLSGSCCCCCCTSLSFGL